MKKRFKADLTMGGKLYVRFLIHQTGNDTWRVKKHYQSHAINKARINENFKTPGEALYAALVGEDPNGSRSEKVLASKEVLM